MLTIEKLLESSPVVTHSGVFHADDVTAVAILEKLSNSKVEIIRTRDIDVLNKAKIRVDVGNTYEIDPEKGIFHADHHQVDIRVERANGIPYAAAGLVWKEAGKQLIRKTFDGLQDVEVDDIFNTIDSEFISPIDATDNGISTFVPIKDCYKSLTLSHLIHNRNPKWWQNATSNTYDSQFIMSVGLVGCFLVDQINSAYGSCQAKTHVLNSKTEYDGKVLVLDKFFPWKEVVIDHKPEVLFVVYKDVCGEYRVSTVPVANSGFENRKSLPSEWAGLRDQELVKVCGVPDATFCHKARFICGAKSLSGAMDMALNALTL